MAFSMPAYIRHKTIYFPAMLLLLSLFLPAFAIQASEAFVIKSIDTQLKEGVYLLNARIEYKFSDEALAALQNGVPLIILMNIEVNQVRWYWNKNIASLEQGYLLIYHALSKKFILHNLNSGTQTDFSGLSNTLYALGHLEQLPLIDANLLEANTKYEVQLRTQLDIESLPAPMRPLAYISSDWRLQSDWYIWPLTP
ncbi:MAG: DUF4390 domain-containing protein [Gammaproteobacteria bacterium]|nr:DUF4390 domain-containing protein [Gammaproteobacteria bacterium]